MPLAANAWRVLESLDPRPDQDPEFYGLLQSLSRGRHTRTGQAPDADLTALALTVGALGDMVNGFPKIVGDVGQAQRTRLQASIRAALHAAARATFYSALATGHDREAMTIRGVIEATELAALLPPQARVSTLEALTVTRLTPDTVDGAVQLWAGAAERIFTNYHLITGIALQEAAATLALLCRAAADTMHDATRRRTIEPDAGRDTARLLAIASTAWRNAATWPSAVQLGGRAYEHHQAVRTVRDALTGPPLARLIPREKTHALQAAVSAAVTIGEQQARAVTWLVNRGGLWVAHERPNLRPPGVARRHVKVGWETMPWDHPAGLLLSDRAQHARTALQEAAEAINSAVLPAITVANAAGRIALVDNRIVWETVEPNTRRLEHVDSRMTSHQRPGIPR
ncbi:MAG TPA: hypothetical protein VGK53_19105 [Propionicimonas sp.]